jgi:glucose-6-phosphate 1-dehydrogenase
MARTSGTTVERPRGAKPRDETPKATDVLVVFGITRDLAKVTFRSLYRLEQRGLLDCTIVGVAVDDWTDDDLTNRARTSIEGTGEQIDDKIFDRFAERLSYVSGDFVDASTYERVGDAIDGASTPVFYLETPPFLFGGVVKGLAEAGLTEGGRVVVEKPFGHDLESAAVLLHAAMVGDSTRFTRQDGVEEQWRIMQPLLDARPAVQPYAPRSWGPEAADELASEHGGWYGPWLTR